jgi:hypothetical protein
MKLLQHCIKAKENEWLSLAVAFNSQSTSGVMRTAEQLKACWGTIKKAAKKNLAADKVIAGN